MMQDLGVLVRRTVFEMAQARGELEGKPVMRDTDDVKWALVDLLKELARIYSDNSADSQFLGPYGPEFQAELVRIARTLGVELPMPPDTDEEVEV